MRLPGLLLLSLVWQQGSGDYTAYPGDHPHTFQALPFYAGLRISETVSRATLYHALNLGSVSTTTQHQPDQ